MSFSNAYIPLNHIWSTPFAKWQGTLAEVNSLDLAVETTRSALAARGTATDRFTHWALGQTVIQKGTFFGVTTVSRRLDAGKYACPWINRACATSAAVIDHLAAQVELGRHSATLGVLSDRTSNAPLVLWPTTKGPGGAPQQQHWMLDSFANDPTTGHGMLATAEFTASDGGFTREQADDLTLLRYEQYQRSLANDRAFQRRFMIDVRIPDRRGEIVLTEDEGVFPTTRDGLARLRPVNRDGIVTFGSQTHPADAAAGCSWSRTTTSRANSTTRRRCRSAERVSPATSRPECRRPPSAPLAPRSTMPASNSTRSISSPRTIPSSSTICG